MDLGVCSSMHSPYVRQFLSEGQRHLVWVGTCPHCAPQQLAKVIFKSCVELYAHSPYQKHWFEFWTQNQIYSCFIYPELLVQNLQEEREAPLSASDIKHIRWEEC